MSHVLVLKGPVWVLMVPCGFAFKPTVHGYCGPRSGSVLCLEILTDPAQTVTTDYGRFAYGCSQARKASARARTVPTREPYGIRRVDVLILTILKNTDDLQNAHMHVTMHIEEG